MKNITFLSLLMLSLSSCFKGEKVDLIIHNAKIYSMNMRNDVFQAMAIKDGKIIELGSEREILNKYTSIRDVDAEQREIYPGFYDAHTHLFGYAEKKLTCDLTGAKSMNDVLSKLEHFVAQNKVDVIVGSGWDQSLWTDKNLPNNDTLSKLFPNNAVLLYRIDGHSLLVNQKAISQANVSGNEKIEGGQIIQSEGIMTGIILDNAMQLFDKIKPVPTNKQLKEVLLEVQEELLQFGITNINEAGINIKQLAVLQELEKEGKLKINVYAMLFPGEEEVAFAKKEGIYKTKHIHVRSFKVIGDGALGSRGACLSSPYSDDSTTYGFLLHPVEYFREIAQLSRKIGYQMNTHCIGDSTNHLILQIIAEATKGLPDHRWRIEHAQVVNPADIELYRNSGTIPSVQPTHAMSDMRFAKDRLGKEREQWAYAYKNLLKANGIIVLGTDFPVEQIDPFLTIEAAVNRKNIAGEPRQGYMKDQAITLDECLKGMTIWPAVACFEENEQGSLEPYKDATFVILYNVLNGGGSFTNNYAKEVFNKGQSVYLFE